MSNEHPVSENGMRDPSLDRISTLDPIDPDDYDHARRARLVLALLQAFVAYDEPAVNQLLLGASCADLHWIAGRLANVATMILIERHGQDKAAAIIDGLIAETTTGGHP